LPMNSVLWCWGVKLLMNKVPFQLLIKQNLGEKQTESLMCRALLRAIPGRREIYDALWNDRDVIVKVFSHRIKGKYHLKREWRGLTSLRSRGLSSPEPLFYGQTKSGGWAMVTEKIAGSSTALEIFDKAQDWAKKLDLLILVCREMAKQHGKGVLQKDLHLGNFLMGGNRVFALDTGQMRFMRCEIDRKSSISQLARLACYLPDSNTEAMVKLCEEYFDARGWRFEKPDEMIFQKQLTAHRKKGVNQGLKKSLRTSKWHLRIKTGGYLAVFDKNFCTGAEPVDFIERIDAMMDKGRILKKGNTCYVSHTSWNGKNIVVKRYNHKGLIHSLCHTIKRSRARRGWLNSHRLLMLNIATPRPLAYIERHKGMLVWDSYLVTEYIQGQRLYDFLRDSNVTKEKRSTVIQQIREILDKLGKYRISHGDLKHSNILITENGPVLTDLDGMTVHKWKRLYKVNRTKDLARLSIPAE